MIGYSGKKAKFYFTLTASCLYLTISAVPAHAGFEWIPPQGSPAPDMQKPNPVAPVQQEPLTTQPSAQIHSPPVAPSPAPAPMPSATVTGAPVSIIASEPDDSGMQGAYYPAAPVSEPTPQTVAAPAPVPGKLVINPFPSDSGASATVPGAAVKTQLYKPQPSQAAVQPVSVYEAAIGFGSDMPLPLALNQVVPPGYAYSFVDGVNIGARVSWDGGQPWNIVLQNMLAPLNLEAVISGKAVVIRPLGSQRLSQAGLPAAAGIEPTSGGPTSGESALKPQSDDVQVRRNAVTDPGPGPMLPMSEG